MAELIAWLQSGFGYAIVEEGQFQLYVGRFKRIEAIPIVNANTGVYQPKTGQACSCKRGVQRDNCPQCEGTGTIIDFAAIRARIAKHNAGE